MDTVDSLSLGLPISDDYQPSHNELDNLMYLTCKGTINWTMRTADFVVCLNMAGGPSNIRGDKGISHFVSIVCDYLWDHIMGEPEAYSPEQLFAHVQPFLFEWYENSTPEERGCLS